MSKPEFIDRYKILEVLGEGGMGTVYKAHDPVLDRFVAIKVIHGDLFENEIARKRFEREAFVLAKLNHPNIVRIIDVGLKEKQTYLVTEYLSGGTLKQQFGQPMPYQRAAQLLAPIAHALAYAHDQNIVHRDVKPSNILCTEEGMLKLADFGIARLTNSEETANLTATGTSLGSPDYMSPEVSVGKAVDHRTDIYSLGVIFYELITGHKPFEAETPFAVIMKQAQEPLPRPGQFVRGLPPVVEKVLFKALAKQPDERFQSMPDFAEVLDLLGQGKTNLIIKVNLPRKRLTRRTWLAGLVAGLAVAAVLGANLFQRHMPPVVNSTSAIAAAATTVSTGQAAIVTASPTSTSSPTVTLIPTATATLTLTPSSTLFHPALEGTPVAYSGTAITASNAGEVIELARWGTSQINDIAIAPSGAYTASGTSTGVYIHNLADGHLLQFLESEAWVREVAISPDSALVAAWTEDDLLRVWDAASGKRLHTLGKPAYQHLKDPCNKWTFCWPPQGLGLAFSPDGLILAAGTYRQTVALWELPAGKLLYEVKDFPENVTSIAFSPYGDFFITGARGSAQVWKRGDGGLLFTLEAPKNRSDFDYLVAVSPDNLWISVNTCIWSARDGRFVRCPINYGGAISLAFSPDSSWLLMGGFGDGAWGKSFKIGNLNGTTLISYSFPYVRDIHFKDDGLTVLSAALDGTIREFTLENGQVIDMGREFQLDLPVHTPNGLVISPDGKTLVSYTPLRIWNISNGELLATYRDQYKHFANINEDEVFSAGFASDENAIYFVSETGKLYKIDPQNLQIRTLINPGASSFKDVPSLVMAPDGKMIFSPGYDSNAWRTSDGYQTIHSERNIGSVSIFTSDSTAYIVRGSANEGLWLMQLEGRNQLGHLSIDAADLESDLVFEDPYKQRQAPSILCGDITDSLNRLALQMNDGRVILWHTPTETLGTYTILGEAQEDPYNWYSLQPRTHNNVKFSPDGSLLAYTDYHGVIHLADGRSGEHISYLVGHHGMIWSLAFSDDAKILASIGEDGVVRIWGVK